MIYSLLELFVTHGDVHIRGRVHSKKGVSSSLRLPALWVQKSEGKTSSLLKSSASRGCKREREKEGGRGWSLSDAICSNNSINNGSRAGSVHCNSGSRRWGDTGRSVCVFWGDRCRNWFHLFSLLRINAHPPPPPVFRRRNHRLPSCSLSLFFQMPKRIHLQFSACFALLNPSEQRFPAPFLLQPY